MKSEPFLKGQPPTSPEAFAWRTTVVGARRHSSTAASFVMEDRSAESAASCRIFCRPSTMSCRAVIIALTAVRSPFTLEARSVLARSSLPPMRHLSIFRTLEELAASSTIRAAAKLSSVAVNVCTNNLPMLCCTSRSSFSAVPIPLTHSARGSNSAGPCFNSSALTFSLDHSSSCAAARLGSVRGSKGSNNLPLSEKMRSIFRRSCTLRTGPCLTNSRSNRESFEIVRISAGSVTSTMSVMPGKYVRFILDLRFAYPPIWVAFTNGARTEVGRSGGFRDWIFLEQPRHQRRVDERAAANNGLAIECEHHAVAVVEPHPVFRRRQRPKLDDHLIILHQDMLDV